MLEKKFLFKNIWILNSIKILCCFLLFLGSVEAKKHHDPFQAEKLEFSDEIILINVDSKTGAGYLTIKNLNDSPVKLTAVTPSNSNFCAKTELHRHKLLDNGIVKMIPILHGIKINGHSIVEFKQGGKHIMFMGLNQNELESVKDIDLMLHFSNGEVVTRSFQIKSAKNSCDCKHAKDSCDKTHDKKDSCCQHKQKNHCKCSEATKEHSDCQNKTNKHTTKS